MSLNEIRGYFDDSVDLLQLIGRLETLRDEQGNVLRDEKGQPLRGEVLDYGTKRTYDDGYSEPRVITEPTFLENLNYFFSYQLNYVISAYIETN